MAVKSREHVIRYNRFSGHVRTEASPVSQHPTRADVGHPASLTSEAAHGLPHLLLPNSLNCFGQQIPHCKLAAVLVLDSAGSLEGFLAHNGDHVVYCVDLVPLEHPTRTDANGKTLDRRALLKI
jgi:hypothetical protein